MRRTLIGGLAIAAAALTTLGQPAGKKPVLLQALTYGGLRSDYAYGIIREADGEYTMCGTFADNYSDPPEPSFLLQKMSADGKVLLKAAYGAKGNGYSYSWQDCANALFKTSGGYFLTGYTRGKEGANAICALKISLSGDSLWLSTLPESGPGSGNVGAASGIGYDIEDDGYGGAVVVGTSYRTQQFMRIARFSSNGAVLWDTAIVTGVDHQCKGFALARLSGGDFVAGGDWYFNQDSLLLQAVVARFDVNGAMQWFKKYGTAKFESIRGIFGTADGGMVFLSQLYYSRGCSMWLVKLTSSGDTVWTRTFNDTMTMQPKHLIATVDGGFLITGDCGGGDFYGNDILVLKCDSLGREQWRYRYGSFPEVENAYGAIETGNNEYIIAGSTIIAGVTSSDIVMLRIGLRSAPVFPEGPEGHTIYVKNNAVCSLTIAAVPDFPDDLVRYHLKDTLSGCSIDSLSGAFRYAPKLTGPGVIKVIVEAKNRFGQSSEMPVTLIVIGDNGCLNDTDRMDTTITNGNSITLRLPLVIVGSPILEYRWYRDGTLVDSMPYLYLARSGCREEKDLIKAEVTVDTLTCGLTWNVVFPMDTFAFPRVFPSNGQIVRPEFNFSWVRTPDAPADQKTYYRILVARAPDDDSIIARVDSLSDTAVAAAEIKDIQGYLTHQSSLYWRLMQFDDHGTVCGSKWNKFTVWFPTNIPQEFSEREITAPGLRTVSWRRGIFTSMVALPVNPAAWRIKTAIYALNGKTIARLPDAVAPHGVHRFSWQVPEAGCSMYVVLVEIAPVDRPGETAVFTKRFFSRSF